MGEESICFQFIHVSHFDFFFLSLRSHAEIQEFYDYMQLTPIERALRENATAHIESLVLQLWPNAKIKPFGSYAWGFTLPTSDIDLLALDVVHESPLQLLATKLQENDVAEKED